MIFADTFYFLALFNPDDEAYERAVSVAERLEAPLVTTAWVITELADALATHGNRRAAIAYLDDLLSSSGIRLIPSTPALFKKGYGLYRRRGDKCWSLTDCISFVTMTEHRILDALTGDRHFEQAGFRALLK